MLFKPFLPNYNASPYSPGMTEGTWRKAVHMIQTELMGEFKTGLAALREGHVKSALVHLRKAVEYDNANPFCLSYYGLALAKAEHDWATAEDCCLAALRLERNQAHLYLNLGEVYRRAGELDNALATLYNGLQYTRWDPLLVRALEELGIRRQPVLSFLDRKHFLNRHLGDLRHRLDHRQDRLSALEKLRMARG